MSEPWLSAWAKTDRGAPPGQEITAWLPLSQHLADAAGIAERLVDEWVSPLVVRRIASDVGGGHSDVRTLATWLASVHDVGKLSPAFAVQAPPLADAMREHGLDADPRLSLDPARSRVRHEIVGQVAVRAFLTDVLGYPPRGAAAQLAVIVGGHHGIPPSASTAKLPADYPVLSGDASWSRARLAALGWATDQIGGPDVLRRYATAFITRPAQVLLTAIVIMADWIASDAKLFPLRPLHTAREPLSGPDRKTTEARVAASWADLDLPARWTPERFTDVRITFAQRFGRIAHDIRPIQLAATEVALSQQRPGLVIIEAPMGEGKTEAALLAAEALAARSGADGCFVALPTRATSDGMFARVLGWMAQLPGLPADASVVLAHGTASLNDRYRGLLRRGWLRGVAEDGPDDDVGIAHHWLRGRRRGALSQFVVGTVDQALFAGLKSKYLMLRHLGLAGKVVIIDEVHAYDVYMSRYLDRVLHWLGAYGTPVVMLSATLPSARRADLIAAYESGLGESRSPVPAEVGYPCVIASGAPPRSVRASGASLAVSIERWDDGLDALVGAVRAAVDDGACVAVIRNTVSRVQETAQRCGAVLGWDRVTVAHSRFLACDRAQLDRGLLARFGPPGDGVSRPAGHVVVASQVVEQSLDLDFDLLFTDLAPIDLILQRLGRLHRHPRLRPTGVEKPRCVVLGVEDWSAHPARAVRGSRAVYSEHALLRSASLLLDRDEVILPTDIAPLVETAYAKEFAAPADWLTALELAHAAEQRAESLRRESAEAFLLGEVGGPRATLEGWVWAGTGNTDDQRSVGHVRDGGESLEVLVVQVDGDGGLITPSWVPGGEVSISAHLPVEELTARTIAACALRLPPAMSGMNGVGDDVIRALERNKVDSFQQHPLLSGQLVLVLDDHARADVCHGRADFRLAYDLRLGLRHGREP